MILLYMLLGYLLFRFVVGFLIPVFRTTSKMREQFNQMNQNSGHPPNQSPGGNQAGPGNPPAGSQGRNPDASKVGEYIDFEEVKP